MFDKYYLNLAILEMQKARDNAEIASSFVAAGTDKNDLGLRDNLIKIIKKLSSEIERATNIMQDKDLTPNEEH
jgi:hypothetical protein